MESFLYEKRHSTKDCGRRYNISVVRPCGGMTELGIGRAQNVSFASLPGFTELAYDVAAANRYFNKDITLPMVDITDRCTIIVPDETNGIKYNVDEKAIDAMTVAHWIMK